MEFLLALLSLLTAATGAVAGARTPEAGVHQAVGVVAVAPARHAAPRITIVQLAQPMHVADDPVPAVAAETPAAPLYANRRRE
jgi:hypothetical protein